MADRRWTPRDVLDLVMSLNGPVDPVGDSGVDRARLENLKALCNLAGSLMNRIESVSETPGEHMASIKAARDAAAVFLRSIHGGGASDVPMGEVLRMRDALDALYNRDDLTRSAVIELYGRHHHSAVASVTKPASSAAKDGGAHG